jgi:RNA polymerase sigma-70 factor (ECF subfamily)
MDDLIARWIRGDAKAAEELYRAYYDRVRRFALTLGRREVDAEEIAHEAMAAGLEGLRAGKRPDRFTLWILGIAKHLASRTEPVEMEGEVDVADPQRRSEGTMAVRREMSSLLAETLQGLSENDREILDLESRERLSRKEMAERLGVSLDVVHARCQRAYARVRELLSRHFTTMAMSPLAARAPVTYDAIRALRHSFREAVIARHLDGLTEREAARTLGLPAATLRARLESAYELLKCDAGSDFSAAREEHEKRSRDPR